MGVRLGLGSLGGVDGSGAVEAFAGHVGDYEGETSQWLAGYRSKANGRTFQTHFAQVGHR